MEGTQAFGCVGTTIRLQSGIYFDLLDPNPEHILIEDIAAALSKICRFGGHVSQFYSVAEHSWHCADQARVDGRSVDYQRAALLHDAAEAYIGDVVNPLKMLLPEYREIEQRIERVIQARFALSRDVAVWEAVKEIDRAMLIAERHALFTRSPEDVPWTGESEVRPIEREFWCQPPDKAARLFLYKANLLGVS